MIQRRILQNIEKHLDKPEITLIVWPRQVWKTTIMKVLKKKLENKNEKTVFLSLDFESDKNYFVNQENLVNKLRLEFGNHKGFVFIDEIQRKENAWLFLKWIYDMDLPYKFIVSWSGSLELKENIHESLAGRKRIFEVWPIDLQEFIDFKSDYRYSDKLMEFCKIEKIKFNNLLKEYLSFGWFPRVILENTLDGKVSIINEIYRSYLEKDIAYLLKIDRIDAFSMMIKILANSNWIIVNYTDIGKKIWISQSTLKNYLRYAEKTFCTYFIYPFVWHKAKELVKMPISYFIDIWFRNFALWEFKNLESENKLWFVFQNLVWNILKSKIENNTWKLHFRRTMDWGEVDFIIDIWDETIPFEVKYSSFNQIKISKSMRNFIEKYTPSEFYVVNLNLNQEKIIGKTKVIYITISNLLYQENFLKSTKKLGLY